MSTAAMTSPQPSALRAWLALLALSTRRLGWSFQTLLALVVIALLLVLVLLVQAVAASRGDAGWTVYTFGRALVGNIYLRFVLPLLCLCFGTQALGGDWEEKSLVWLLTRPLPRPMIYLAKYLATLPWAVGLSVLGLLAAGALAGRDAWQAALVFWPVVVLGATAYLSLFLLLGAVFRRSTIIALTYTFVVETILSNMPGLVKRITIAFYDRCLLFALAEDRGWHEAPQGVRAIIPDNERFFLPVDGTTALIVLLTVPAVLLVIGIWWFSRKEYLDLT
jgi:ABC-2 type transport system permease protein